MFMWGIDISHWDEDVDFHVLKENGVEFVIIKCGGSDNGRYKDPCFEDYYNRAVQAGLHVGTYYFVGKNFTNVVEARKDAEHMYSIINGKTFDMPIYLDLEAPPKGMQNMVTAACIMFCSYFEQLNYFIGIYGSDISTFKEMCNVGALKQYSMWVARYGRKPTYVPDCAMWQYSEEGIVAGVRGYCDLNECYVDFPNVIKQNHLNGYTSSAPKTTDELAHEVIEGKWGNGEDRKQRLASCGYNYREVQNRVNEILGYK